MTQAIQPGWSWVGEEDKPQNYLISVVYLRIMLGLTMDVPESVLRSPNTRWQTFDEPTQARLDNIIEALDVTANDAYSYWLRIMRWKSGIGYIGEPNLVAQSVRLSPELQCYATDRYFWNARQGFTFPREEEVSVQQWEDAQNALASEAEPPVWLDFLFDGEHRTRNHDFMGAILSLAIAFEAALRSLITDHLRQNAVEALIYELVDLSNINAIMNRIALLSFWDRSWTDHFDAKNLHRLVKTRNDIMHWGGIRDLDEPTVRRHQASVRAFVYQVSRYLKVV
jgi:hypothetical protein